MIAVDVRVSPLEIVALFLAHSVIAGLLIEASLSRLTAFSLLLALSASLVASLRWHYSAHSHSSRIRRFIIADAWSLLLPQPPGAAPVKHALPVTLRCGEYLIILKFSPLAEGVGSAPAKIVRLWPGTLSRADASRLRRALRAAARLE